jgi:sugar-phosphatase
MIKAAIYDLDGLMVNSEPLHAEAWKLLLKEYGHDVSELPPDAHSRWIGMRVKEVLEYIAKIIGVTDLQAFSKRREEIFFELVRNKLEMMPGLMRSLEFFRKNKMNIGLASSGTTIYIELAIDKLSIRKYFNTVVSGDHVKMGKPDPEIYLLAAKRLGLHPEECVVLEDSTKGIQAAKSAALRTLNSTS